jgi:PhnB protein
MGMLTMPNKTEKKARPIPEGYYTVTPFIITRNSAELLDFLSRAFGAQEITRVYNNDAAIGHAETRISDSMVMMFDAQKEWPDILSYLRLYVEDCDAVYQHALKSGATSVTRPANMPWGDRACRVSDPLGNLWAIMTRIENLSPNEIEKRWGQKEYIDAMEYVQRAQLFPANNK